MMVMATNEGLMHVKLAPGVDASYLEQYGSVSPLFTLPYDRLKELSAAEPGLPDLTLWYRVMPTPSISSAQEVITEDLIDQVLITDIVIPVDAPPPHICRQLQLRMTLNSIKVTFVQIQILIMVSMPSTLGLSRAAMVKVSPFMMSNIAGILCTKTWDHQSKRL